MVTYLDALARWLALAGCIAVVLSVSYLQAHDTVRLSDGRVYPNVQRVTTDGSTVWLHTDYGVGKADVRDLSDRDRERVGADADVTFAW
jgi:hypothetical protein